jgi:hypothetical protein
MTITVVRETCHTQCVVFVCNNYWYCHVVSLRLVFGVTMCCTRTLHSVYDMLPLLLVLSCRLSPLGIWYHHQLHTNMTHCV